MKQTKDTRLIHYSRKQSSLAEVVSPSQVEEYQRGPYKPCGLWVSVGTEWLDWCKAENFKLADCAFAHVVHLSDTANLLRLSSAEELDNFTGLYGVKGSGLGLEIDWNRVASAFDGIIIAPYIWERRLTLHTHWYYGWDCASGCIWNASAIAQIQSEPVPEQARLCNQEYA